MKTKECNVKLHSLVLGPVIFTHSESRSHIGGHFVGHLNDLSVMDVLAPLAILFLSVLSQLSRRVKLQIEVRAGVSYSREST